jgi:hypothetical protein
MDQTQILKGTAILAMIVGVVLMLAGLVDVSTGRAGTSELVSGLAAVVVGGLSFQLARDKLAQPREPAGVDVSSNTPPQAGNRSHPA